jgi:hypothetical protein
MFTEEDEAALCRMLGTTEIPEKFQKEYEIRLRLYHSAGHNGPLGAVGLVDLCRFMFHVPEKIERALEEKVDWRRIPTGAYVEAHFMGDWIPGIFKGTGQAGILEVLLEGDDYVRECRPHMVRLSDKPPAKKETLTQLQQRILAEEKEEQRRPEPETVIEEVLNEVEDQLDYFDWTMVKAGALVWLGEESVDGIFHEFGSDDDGSYILAQVDGESELKKYAPDDVRFAEDNARD